MCVCVSEWGGIYIYVCVCVCVCVCMYIHNVCVTSTGFPLESKADPQTRPKGPVSLSGPALEDVIWPLNRGQCRRGVGGVGGVRPVVGGG